MKKLHTKAVWLFFLQAIGSMLSIFFLLVVISIFNGIIAMILDKNDNAVNFVSFFLKFFVVCLFILAVASFVYAKLKYKFYKYELTGNEYRAERGIIWKRYVSIPYSRIQNIDIYRGIIDRILGLSDLQIHTAGYGASGAKKIGSEGRLHGLSMRDAESLRSDIMNKIKESNK